MTSGYGSFQEELFIQESAVTGLAEQRGAGYVRAILDLYDEQISYKELTIINPLNESLFPADIAAPYFEWIEEEDGIEYWLVTVRFAHKQPIHITCSAARWIPAKDIWETIKHNSMDSPAQISVLGIRGNRPPEIVSKGSIRIRTSRDDVGSPIMFRRVPPSFSYADLHPELMEWCLGDLSSYEKPPIIMSKQPVCASCHTFSRDGVYCGMDVDYKNDKGSYFLGSVGDQMMIADQNLFSWNDFPRNDGLQSSGLFSRLSPDGNHVVSTIDDISFLAKISDPYCSQLFFPIQGSLAYYSKSDRAIYRLMTSSDRREIVETDPSWGPEGNHILFARATMTRDLFRELGGETVFSAVGTDIAQLNEKYPVQFNIYRVPFNGGKGGRAEALAGASHNGKSNYFARCSPDGKWIVFTQSRSGLVLQPDSQLLILSSKGGKPQRMRCNRGRLNSWHSWAPNSRWLAFVSKENMPYTELYLTHIDDNGDDSVPIRISRFNKPGYAINVPEFANIAAKGIRKIAVQMK